MLMTKKLKMLLITLGIIVLLVILVALRVINTEPYRYKYQKLDSYSLPGFVKGSGMSFNKPIEATEVDKLPQTKDQQILTHSKLVKGKYVTLFYEAAASEYNFTQTPYTHSQILKDQQFFLDTALQKDNPYTAGVNKFLSYNINPRFKLSVGKFQKFSSNNIKDGAVVAEIDAIDPHPANLQRPAHLKGKVLFTAGANGSYYFYIAAVDYNWGSNQTTWQKILDSMKIDQ
jgi:hypothetical protein